MSNRTLVKLDNSPKWDFTIVVRGIEIALRSPEAITVDTPAGAPPTQAMLDAQSDRWPGLLRWIIRFIVGGPRVVSGEIPTDGGAGFVRDVVMLQVGEHHKELIDKLSTGECAQIHAAYMRCQQVWMEAVGNYAATIAQEQYASFTPPTPAAADNGVGEQLVPGGPLPISLDPKHNPLVRDNRPAIMSTGATKG